jgi:Sjoegren syndrome nuclear autoantigen 1
MTQQGAALQTYNNELVKSVEELKVRRAALQTTIEQETDERDRLEGERALLEERLAVVGSSLAERVAQGKEYDRIIHKAEQVIG